MSKTEQDVLEALAAHEFEWWFVSEAYLVPGVCDADLGARSAESEVLEMLRDRLVALGVMAHGEPYAVSHQVHWTIVKPEYHAVFRVKLDLTLKDPIHLLAPAHVARMLLTEALGQGPSSR